MILTHLRRNGVAYLALVIALSTGTAYAAAQISDGSVTTKKLANNAVTSTKIAKNAVKSSDIKNRSVTPADLSGVTWVGGKTVESSFENAVPGAVPDLANVQTFDATLPRAGTLQVELWNRYFTGGCPAGDAFVGLYVDGKPVPGTKVLVDSTPESVDIVATVRAKAGAHHLSLGYDCPDTNAGYNGFSHSTHTWSLVLAP